MGRIKRLGKRIVTLVLPPVLNIDNDNKNNSNPNNYLYNNQSTTSYSTLASHIISRIFSYPAVFSQKKVTSITASAKFILDKNLPNPTTITQEYCDGQIYNTVSKQKKIIYTTLLRLKMAHSPEDYKKVAKAIVEILPRKDYDDGSTGPVLVRLAWHACGTYDKTTGTGGSNGSTMRYKLESEDSANKGLEYAREFLEPIKAKFPWITYADLWTLAGAVAIEAMDGPHVDWKPGRVDYIDESNVPPNGRLPDGSLGADHIRDVFYRMGFNDQEIVALSGAHGLGRTHANRSGFDGPWVNNPTRFSNTYYKLLLNEEWHLGTTSAGMSQFWDTDEELMMLPTDMALVQDPTFREWVVKYAEDKDLFYRDFSKAFAKLLELGIRRDKNGVAHVNLLNKLNNPVSPKL
jgi:peroxiredoxin